MSAMHPQLIYAPTKAKTTYPSHLFGMMGARAKPWISGWYFLFRERDSQVSTASRCWWIVTIFEWARYDPGGKLHGALRDKKVYKPFCYSTVVDTVYSIF